jgi:hypothetical protein
MIYSPDVSIVDFFISDESCRVGRYFSPRSHQRVEELFEFFITRSESPLFERSVYSGERTGVSHKSVSTYGVIVISERRL